MSTDTQVNGVAARHSSETNEHYSPSLLVEPARATLGGAIDLDPFSCALANTIVRATRFYSLEAGEDGFALPWFGRAFVNAPGGKNAETNESNQKRGWFKLAREYAAGRVTAAVFVCFSVELLQATQIKPPAGLAIPLDFPICYPRARIHYLTSTLPGPTPKNPDRKPTRRQREDHARTGLCTGKSPPHASCLIFLPPSDLRVDRPSPTGVAIQRFRAAFGPIGRVVVPQEAGR